MDLGLLILSKEKHINHCECLTVGYFKATIVREYKSLQREYTNICSYVCHHETQNQEGDWECSLKQVLVLNLRLV